MSAESFYGSSEYSPRAEELFARYVRSVEQGAQPDFEAYCELHPEFRDELLGLHTDWDNVRGLLSKLKALDPGSEARSLEPLGAQQQPVPTPGAAVASSPGRELQRDRRRGWLGLAGLALFSVAALLLWNRNLRQGQEVLARERDELQHWGTSTERKLELELARGERLQQRGDSLDRSLTQEREDKERLAQLHAELSRREVELRQQHELQDQKLQSLHESYLALDHSKADLAREYEAERLASEQASSAALEAKQRFLALAKLTSVKALLEREALLWPAQRELPERIASWLLEAGALGAESAALEAALVDLVPGSPVLASLLEDLDCLTASDGLLERTRARHARLKELLAAQQGEHAQVWSAWQASLADAQQSPRYEGLELAPQFGLWPSGFDRELGLWRLADLTTAGTLEADAEPLVYYLIPGGVFGAQRCEPFLLASSLPSAAQQRAAGLAVPSATPSAATANALRASLPEALRRLGLRWPSELERDGLRRAGLAGEPWSLLPVSSLRD